MGLKILRRKYECLNSSSDTLCKFIAKIMNRGRWKVLAKRWSQCRMDHSIGNFKKLLPSKDRYDRCWHLFGLVSSMKVYWHSSSCTKFFLSPMTLFDVQDTEAVVTECFLPPKKLRYEDVVSTGAAYLTMQEICSQKQIETDTQKMKAAKDCKNGAIISFDSVQRNEKSQKEFMLTAKYFSFGFKKWLAYLNGNYTSSFSELPGSKIFFWQWCSLIRRLVEEDETISLAQLNYFIEI